MLRLTKRHFEAIASIIRTIPGPTSVERKVTAERMAVILAPTHPRFNRAQFVAQCLRNEETKMATLAAKNLRRGDIITVNGEDHTIVSARFVTGLIEVEVTDRRGSWSYGMDESVEAWSPGPSVGYRADD